MSSPSPGRPVLLRALAPIERLYDALVDPTRAERTMVGLLAAFVGAYTVYAVLSNASVDVNWDVGELVAWSRQPAWGYKHPPMSAWFALLWFSAFPIADWSAYLLAMTVSGLTIWISWRLFADWLDADRRVLATAMLTLIPLYTFHALKFNANTVMMPFWAAATLFFLRGVALRTRVDSALAGVAGAGAMLGKYWSVNLIAGLGLAAIVDRRRAEYFRSPAPWITLVCATIVFLPHLLWMRSSGSVAVDWALALHGDNAARSRSVSYVAGCVAYVIVPLLLFGALRPTRAAVADTVRPTDADRLLVGMAFLFPLMLPAIINLVFPTRITSLWTIPNWTLFPVVLLGSPLLKVRRGVVVAALALAVTVPVLALFGAPAVAATAHRASGKTTQSQFALLARAAEGTWRRATTAPLAVLGGDDGLSYGASFYATDRPIVITVLDSGAASRIGREGIVMLCLADDPRCVSSLDSVGARGKSVRDTVTLAREYRGSDGAAQRYVIQATPPRNGVNDLKR